MLSKMLRGSVNNTTNPAIPTDPNFKQVSLLLHGDGTNGAQNNTFLDSSSNNFTITRNGNTTQGTNTPFSQGAGYWSNYNPTASYLTVATNAAFTYGVSDFTMECWVYLTTTGAIQYVIDQRNSGTANAVIPAIYVSASNVLTYFVSNAAQITGTTALTVGTWYHVAVSRSTLSTKMFLNGVQEGSTYTDANSYAASRVVIGSNAATAGNYLVGYISNVRLVNGTGVYTTTFTPSTTPLTAITNTSLLTCQSSYFKDNSSNNFTLTATGTPSVQPFSPFAPTSAYSTSVNGGSMYIPATAAATSYISVANNTAFDFGSGDFTIEFWYNAVTNVASTGILAKGWGVAGVLGPFLFYNSGTALQFYSSTGNSSWDIASGANIISSVSTGTWYHVAVSRQGSSIRTFANGVLITTVTSSATVASNTYPVTINYHVSSAQGGEYIADLRLVKGTAVYTANFTPPTAPLTAITNTSLLLSGTNAGIYDNAIKNDLQTVGNAQVSTSVVKYGTGSMKFNGTTDYLTAPTSPQFAFGTGAWTIEGWVYPSSVTALQSLIDTRATATSTTGVLVSITALGFISVTVNNAILFTSSTAMTLSAWTHVAVVQNGTTITLYLNGTKPTTGSGTSSTSLTDQYLRLGASAGTAANFYNGYLDDVRITTGIARYTANFTAPTSAFPNQ